MIVACIIALATLENVWPLITGLLKAPPGYVFLGTVHYPADYFYYLSQFAQGSQRWLTTMNLFSAESVSPTLVGWSNVLIGRIFHLFGLSPFVAYHTSVVILTIIVLASGYRLAERITGDKRIATLALYLFTLFHAFPRFRDGKPSYGDYWNNFAVPRVRFGGVPHQLLLNIASMLMVYFAIQWQSLHSRNQRNSDSGNEWKLLVGLGLSSIVLASLQPVLWVLITASLILTRGLPFVIAFATGLLPLLYLARLFTTLPFSQLKLWEAGAQNVLTPEHFLSSTGPVFLIALFSLPLFASHLSLAKLFVMLFSLFSLILFLSPLPVLLGISQARFMSTLTILCLSVMASSGLMQLINAKHKVARMSGALLIVGVSWLLIPNHVKTLQLSSSFNPGNAYYYLPAEAYEFLQKSGRIGKPDETFLVTWPYNEVFPALTGKRSYHGHPLITIKSTEKDALAIAILNGSVTSEATRAFYADNDIAYLIGTTDNVYLANSPLVTRVSASKTLVLYKVL